MYALYLLGTRALTYLFTQLLRGYKTETVEDRAKVTINGLYKLIKSYTGFRLPPKCMTLNDLCARFKAIIR